MPTSVNQNTDTAAGMEVVIVTENEREGACLTICLGILRPSEIPTTSSSLRQALRNLLDTLADAARD
jgi:hypothetical protein